MLHLVCLTETVKSMSRNYQTIHIFSHSSSLATYNESNCHCASKNSNKNTYTHSTREIQKTHRNGPSAVLLFCNLILCYFFYTSILEICFDASPQFRLLLENLNIRWFSKNQVKRRTNKPNGKKVHMQNTLVKTIPNWEKTGETEANMNTNVKKCIPSGSKATNYNNLL